VKAIITGSPTQTFFDPSANTSEEAEGKVAFEVVQFKDLPEGAEVVTADGDEKSGTQTVTGNAVCTWSNLPNHDDDGNTIYYYVVEKQATAQADTMSVAYSYEYNADGTISKVIITNTTTGTPTPTKGDIIVTKSFVGLDGVDLPANFKITNDYDDQEFTISNASGTNPYTWTLSGIDDGTTVTFTENGATVNGYDLTVTSGGTVVADSSVSATVVAGDTVSASLVNTYEQKKVRVTLKKVDKTNVNKEILQSSDLLDGAKFILEKYEKLTPTAVKDTEWNDAHNAVNEGTDGVFTFTDLPVGIYKIVEKGYPTGYVQLTSDPVFEVVVDSETGDLGINLLDDAGGLVKLVDGELTIIVGNEPGAALPNTGGPGTRLFTIFGSFLILGAGVLLWRRRRLI
jgi:LPXTG-motif cell wall-anchored protein